MAKEILPYAPDLQRRAINLRRRLRGQRNWPLIWVLKKSILYMYTCRSHEYTCWSQGIISPMSHKRKETSMDNKTIIILLLQGDVVSVLWRFTLDTSLSCLVHIQVFFGARPIWQQRQTQTTLAQLDGASISEWGLPYNHSHTSSWLYHCLQRSVQMGI